MSEVQANATDADIVDYFGKVWAAVQPGFHTANVERYHCISMIYAAHDLRIFHSLFFTGNAGEWMERLVIIDPHAPIVADRLICACEAWHDGIEDCEPILLDPDDLMAASNQPSLEGRTESLSQFLAWKKDDVEEHETNRSLIIRANDWAARYQFDAGIVLDFPGCYGVNV